MDIVINGFHSFRADTAPACCRSRSLLLARRRRRYAAVRCRFATASRRHCRYLLRAFFFIAFQISEG